MKPNRMLITLVLILLFAGQSVAQGGKKGTARPVMPVDGRVKVDQGRTKPEQITVKVFQDNRELATIPIKNGKFKLELDLEGNYAILITKPGYKNKLILMDTHVPTAVAKYPTFPCHVDMEPETGIASGDPFFNDFPTAVIRYQSEIGGHAPSATYAAQIRAVQGNLATAKP